MRVFSFVAQSAPEIAHNAAPVLTQPVNPFAAAFQAETPRINPFRTLTRDTFVRQNAESTAQTSVTVLPPFNVSFAWLLAHTPEQVNQRLDAHLEKASWDDLRQAIGLLHAAQKGRKLVFADGVGSQLSFHRHYGRALDALENEDAPAAKLYMQRARRELAGFKGLQVE